MANISIDEIKRLRSLTGVGITDAKQALIEADGDFDKALSEMRKKGLTKAEKRAEREARSGLIGSYVHDGRIGVLIEVNCETDFVAKTDEFKDLVKDLALHIAASAPQYVSIEEIPQSVRKVRMVELAHAAEAGSNKSQDVVHKIIEGQLNKYMSEIALLEQPFIKNPDQTVGEVVREANAKLGENIIVRRFARLALGEVS
ncbi:translation elongation factor Ts [Candidatus Saccharibacteria bacterium]|nr:translation elongation factor Ts [Candidatus Saccharibacteria bacterium]